MVLFLGVCKALKAMHQYRVREGPGGVESQKKARRVRQQAARADAEAAEAMEMSKGAGAHDEHDEDAEAAPLMEGEVTMSQEGAAPGDLRAYAHRDIKPGDYLVPSDESYND